MTNMSHFFITFRMRDKMASFELCVSPVLMENQHIRNVHSSLTLYNRKLIWYFRIPVWQIWVIFFILFRMRDKMVSFELCITHVLMENQHIWNFYSSLTLYNRKLIWYFRSPWYTIMSNMSHFSFCLEWETKWPVLNCVFHLYWCKINTFGIFTAHWLCIIGN